MSFGNFSKKVLFLSCKASDLTEGAQPTTAGGDKVTITLSGGAKVKGNGNTSASNIVATDIVTTNEVIHAIDRVLLP